MWVRNNWKRIQVCQLRKVVVILGILLAGSLQADGHLPDEAAMLKKAESFIDAFYSFESEKLAPLFRVRRYLGGSILYYQAWAKGGNYKVMNRENASLPIRGPSSAQ